MNDQGKGILYNVDAVLRSKVELKVRVEIEKMFPGHGVFRGKIVSSGMVDSKLTQQCIQGPSVSPTQSCTRLMAQKKTLRRRRCGPLRIYLGHGSAHEHC